MKIVCQVVKKASVKVNNKVVSSINDGELLLVSFNNQDNEQVVDKMIDKLLKMRIFEDKNGKTNLSIYDKDGSILAVSQFTLYASMHKTNRPSFINCMNQVDARRLFEYFQSKLKDKYSKSYFGVFREYMEVELINDGPFTIILDSEEI